MVEEFLAFITQNNLIKKSDRVLLAISGGVDSIVMMHLFKSVGLNFGVAHCNFSLRATESDEDEEFVKKLCLTFDVEFYSKRFNTKEYATINKVSTQMAARKLRYEWFTKLCNEKGFTRISTAHHLNDSIETVLFNLTKGTGLRGLTGIKPKNGLIIRPMLFADRDQIEDYAKLEKLNWREDSSNEEVKYSRNLLRLEVLPLLKKINPSLEETFKKNLHRFSDTQKIVNKKVSKLKKKYWKEEGLDVYIDKEAIKNKNSVLLNELIKSFGFNYVQVQDILTSIDTEGKIFESEDYLLNVDRSDIIISPRKNFEGGVIQSSDQYFKNDLFELKIDKSEDVKSFYTQKEAASLDIDKLDFPLTVRLWREGDSFHPLGMNHKKKLSDFMIDSKIPLNLKRRVFVLESNGKIAWVIGHRMDNRFKVTDSTERLLNIVMTSND